MTTFPFPLGSVGTR